MSANEVEFLGLEYAAKLTNKMGGNSDEIGSLMEKHWLGNYLACISRVFLNITELLISTCIQFVLSSLRFRTTNSVVVQTRTTIEIFLWCV